MNKTQIRDLLSPGLRGRENELIKFGLKDINTDLRFGHYNDENEDDLYFIICVFNLQKPLWLQAKLHKTILFTKKEIEDELWRKEFRFRTKNFCNDVLKLYGLSEIPE